MKLAALSYTCDGPSWAKHRNRWIRVVFGLMEASE